MAAERSAARIERMGYDVGYRLCERLAQHRPLLGPGSPSPETGTIDEPTKDASGGVGGAIIMGGGGHHTVMDSKSELISCFLYYYAVCCLNTYCSGVLTNPNIMIHSNTIVLLIAKQ